MAQSFYDLFQIDPEEERAMARVRSLTPAQRTALEGELGQAQAVRGVETLGRTALGIPQPPQADRQSAAAELTALAQRVRPGTEEFYSAAIPILQKYNLPAEAEAMEKQRLALEVGKAEMTPALKLQRARDMLSKRPDAASPQVQAALAAIDREIAALGVPKTGGADPELVRLQQARAAATDPAVRAELDTAIKNYLAAKDKTAEKPMSEAERRRVELAEKKEGRAEAKDTAKVTEAESSAVNALQASIRALDEEITAATQLLAHPGFDGIFGPRTGALPDAVVAAMTGDRAGAMAHYLRMQGQTFIRALQDLKATSKTGASGLGQLTEVEGNKIQQAKAAINRQQEPAQARRTITAYLANLQSGRKTAKGILTAKKAEVPVAPPVPSDRPAVAAPVAALAATPGRRFRTVR